MQAYIVSAVRTAIGKAPHGALHAVRPDDLGAIALQGALARVPTLSPNLIEDVVIGCAMPEAEQGYNLRSSDCSALRVARLGGRGNH